MSWQNPSDDDAVYAFADNFIDGFKEAAEELGVLHPYLYVNYADKGQDVFASYGEENNRRLIEIQKSVDPKGIFTSSGLWRGFFKLQ